jgi:hypothetical protein
MTRNCIKLYVSKVAKDLVVVVVDLSDVAEAVRVT